MNAKMKSQRGAWLASGSPVIAELAVECGVDWVLMDMEHGYLTEPDILPNLVAFKGSQAKSIIRIPSHDTALIGRILDRGASGFMAPHVDTAEQAKALVQGMRYTPDGSRGFARSTRAYRFGLSKKASNQTPLFFAQIESKEAVQNVGDIAAVDGVSVLFVGPADLKHDLTARGEDTETAYAAALDTVLDAAQANGKQAGIFLRNREEADKMAAKGFQWIAVDSDLGMLRAGFLK